MQVVATGTYPCPKLYVTKKYLLLQVRRFDIAFFSLYVIKKYLLMQVENGVEQKALKLYVIKKYLLLQVCARIHHRFVLLYVTEKYLLLQAQENYKLRWLLYVIPKYLLMQALYVVIPLALNYMLPTNTCCSRLTRCLIQKKEHFMLSKNTCCSR